MAKSATLDLSESLYLPVASVSKPIPDSTKSDSVRIKVVSLEVFVEPDPVEVWGGDPERGTNQDSPVAVVGAAGFGD